MADDWKAEARRFILASIAHLSNPGKYDREQWVVEKLLAGLGVQFGDNELIQADEPADVAFREARFQVKEILDRDRKRLDEYRADLLRLDAARTLADMLTPYEPKDLTLADVVVKVGNLAAELRQNYGPHERRHLDLLVYVNILGVEIVDDGTQFALAQHPGFRSLSFVAGGLAGVLWAEGAAPDFIRRSIGTIRRTSGSE